jgi:DNA-binding PadR family transcriptional regulator
MSYRIVLLGMLTEQPRYGYEIKQTFEEGSFAEYMKISGGGLYYTLHKLVEEGYITERTVERESNYPDRHIYEITPEGKQYFVALLRETLSDKKSRAFFDPIDAALHFGMMLPTNEVVARLQGQLDLSRSKLMQLELLHSVFQKVGDKFNPYASLILEHAIHRIKSDMSWIESIKKRIEEEPEFEEIYQRSRQSGKPTFEVLESDPEFITEGRRCWGEFESGIEKAVNKYFRKAKEAWQEYETRLTLPDPTSDLLAQAKQDYAQKTAKAWQEYEEALEREQQTIETVIKKMRQAE